MIRRIPKAQFCHSLLFRCTPPRRGDAPMQMEARKDTAWDYCKRLLVRWAYASAKSAQNLHSANPRSSSMLAEAQHNDAGLGSAEPQKGRKEEKEEEVDEEDEEDEEAEVRREGLMNLSQNLRAVRWLGLDACPREANSPARLERVLRSATVPHQSTQQSAHRRAHTHTPTPTPTPIPTPHTRIHTYTHAHTHKARRVVHKIFSSERSHAPGRPATKSRRSPEGDTAKW